jgi:hypothetical protein
MMLVSLNTADTQEASTKTVGGKAASLARLYKIPPLKNHATQSYALSTSFFQPWGMDVITASAEYDECQSDGISLSDLEAACSMVKQKCQILPLSPQQQEV